MELVQNRPLNVFTIDLPLRQPFRWRVLLTLVLLYFLGNLAGIPLLRATQAPIEPVWLWGAFTLVSALILGLSLVLANRTGLGAPFLAGQLSPDTRLPWFRTGLALTVLLTVAGLPLSLWLNLNVDPVQYPAAFPLILASVKAGIVEELGYRFFMVSLLVWLGSRFSRRQDGRPTRQVYWAAILLAGLIFGWAHVDARLGVPQAPIAVLASIMILSSLLGVAFGWFLWRLGLEWAIFAHFAYDAVVSAVLLKVYLSANVLVWIGFVVILILVTWAAWRAIRPTGHLTGSRS